MTLQLRLDLHLTLCKPQEDFSFCWRYRHNSLHVHRPTGSTKHFMSGVADSMCLASICAVASDAQRHGVLAADGTDDVVEANDVAAVSQRNSTRDRSVLQSLRCGN